MMHKLFFVPNISLEIRNKSTDDKSPNRTVLLMGFGAAVLGKRFRIYTFASWVIFIIFGILTGLDAPRIGENLSTPLIGVWERINIGVFMIWIVVLAISLLQKENVRDRIDNLK